MIELGYITCIIYKYEMHIHKISFDLFFFKNTRCYYCSLLFLKLHLLILPLRLPFLPFSLFLPSYPTSISIKA